MKQLTPEQKAATRPDQNIFVGASAGTGKTHVLSARVLRMMVIGTPPDHILCLTYTKAAAAVMANRIYQTLGEWALTPEKELPPKIFAATGEAADDTMVARSRALFATVLDLPGGLKIQTIHSFCQSLLGRFPIEARLAPHFHVVDERTAAELLQKASETVMDIAGADEGGELYSAFAGIARQTNEEDFRKILTAFLAARGKILFQQKTFGGSKGLIDAVYRTLGLEPGETREGVLTEVFSPENLDRVSVQKLFKVLEGGSVSEIKAGKALKAFLAHKGNQEFAFASYRGVFLTQKGPPRVNVLTKKNREEHPGLVAFAKAEGERLSDVLDKLARLQVAENTKNLITLGTATLALYQAEKNRFGYLDYDDLIFKTRDLLDREGIAPWILFKLDGGIDHILVDEAQDTNQVQWAMVETLSEEFFAGFGSREEAIRTVFAVGDPKQSIYRFQGAEPGEFQQAKRRIQVRAEAAGLTFKTRDLAKSFRSTRVVLDVVDEVFKAPPAAAGVIADDKTIRHEAERIGMSGLVEVWPPETPDEADEKPAGWRLPFEQKFTPRPEARLASKIAAHIDGLIEGGEKLKARGRAIRCGDILVLVQRRGPFMDYLIRELKSLGVPVAGSDRMTLSEQLVVQDLLALGRFALLPEDDFNLAVVLKGPLLDFSDDDLMALAIGRKGSLWLALNAKARENKKFAAGLALLKEILARADFVTPFAFYAWILGTLSGRVRFYRRLGPEVGDPLDEFLSLCQAFQKDHTPSLQGFLKWFAASETQIKRDMESGRNEVRIMTVHGAKGLEAPVVYLPDTFRTLKSRTDTLLQLEDGLLVWAGKKENETGPVVAAREAFMADEKEEMNRLLYVALTRAEDRLYVSGWCGAQTATESVWYDAIRNAVAALPGVQKFPAGGKGLRLETPQKAKAKDESKASARARRGTAPLKPWALTPATRTETGYETLAPSRAEGGLCVTPGEFRAGRDKAIQRGTIIHKLLEILPGLPPAKRQKAMTGYLKTPANRLSGDEQKEIRGKVTKVLNDPAFCALFAPGSRAEVSLAGVIEGRLTAGQIDRVAVSGNEVLIVDYKSNTNPPAKIEKIPEAYIRQLQLYAGLLSKIYPGKNIRAALLWTETAALMEIPPEMLKSPPLDEPGGST